MGGISHFRCFCQGMKSISLQTTSNLLTTLGTEGLANTSDLKVPLPFLCKQRELTSTSSGVHIGTDKKAERPGLLKDPSQVAIVPLPLEVILPLICTCTVHQWKLSTSHTSILGFLSCFTLNPNDLSPIGPRSHIQRCPPCQICWLNSSADDALLVPGETG